MNIKPFRDYEENSVVNMEWIKKNMDMSHFDTELKEWRWCKDAKTYKLISVNKKKKIG